MILVDARIGSGDLVDVIKEKCAFDQVTKTTLPFGDAAFYGRGPNERPIRIGIEIKALNDALGSMRSGRVAGHQLPGLKKDFDVVYFIIQGLYRPGHDGSLETLRGRGWGPVQFGGKAFMYIELDNWLNSLATMANVIVKKTESRYETACVIVNLWRWWNNKSWEHHKSHVGFDQSGQPTLIKPGLVQRVAAQFQGIGWERAGSVAERFKTVASLVDASTKEWMEIDGIGKVLSNRIHQDIRREGVE